MFRIHWLLLIMIFWIIISNINTINSTFIQDINSSKFSSYNSLYKGHKGESSKGIKVTNIVGTYGIPISVNIDTSKKHDYTLLHKAVNNIEIVTNSENFSNHNRYKQYFLTESGYNSKDNIKKLLEKGKLL